MSDTEDTIESGHLGDTTVVRKKHGGRYAHAVIRDKHQVTIDEPEWLPMGIGNDEYPAPVDHLALALVSCQVEVLDQALQKARVEDYEIEAEAEIDKLGEGGAPEGMPANTAVLIDHIDIELTLEVPEEHEERAERCLDVYDGGCIVGRSYRDGIDYTPHTNLHITDD